MKATFSGLEGEIVLSIREAITLHTGILTGHAKIYEVGSDRRTQTALTLCSNPQQEEDIAYSFSPQGYYFDAYHLSFALGREMYADLLAYGEVVSRFSSGGKLNITIDSQKRLNSSFL